MHAIRMTATVAAFVGVTLLLSAPAGAATLSGSGLMIDTGSGYHNVSAPIDVAPGTSVIATPDGEGVIRYADGCEQRVRRGEVAIVLDASPCEAGLIRPDTGMRIGEYGLIIGGIVVGGGVIAAIALSGGDNDKRKPKSP